MKLLLIIGSAITTHARIKVITYSHVDETNKTYVLRKDDRKIIVYKSDLMKVDSNTLNTTSVHFSVWCLDIDKDAGITAIRKATSEKVTENYERAKAIFDKVNAGMSVIPEHDTLLPNSGDLKL